MGGGGGGGGGRGRGYVFYSFTLIIIIPEVELDRPACLEVALRLQTFRRANGERQPPRTYVSTVTHVHVL